MALEAEQKYSVTKYANATDDVWSLARRHWAHIGKTGGGSKPAMFSHSHTKPIGWKTTSRDGSRLYQKEAALLILSKMVSCSEPIYISFSTVTILRLTPM